MDRDRATRPMARASRFCHLCGRRLTGQYFRYENALVVCAACQARRPRCVRCSVPLPEGAPEPRLCAACARTVPRCACCGDLIPTTWYTFEDLVPASAPRHFCARCVAERPRCDLCRAPVSPAATSTLPDGQRRCALCAMEMVLATGEAEQVYNAALAAFRRVLEGGAPGTMPRLTLVSRREMSALRQQFGAAVATEGPATTTATVAAAGGHHVLGFFVQAHGTSTIYAEMGLPRPLLLGTLAHELGHAWQAERAPGLRDPLLCEGFAEWVAYRVLVSQGHEAIAARALRREDIYGKGLRHYQWIERAGGVPGVLAAATGVGRAAR